MQSYVADGAQFSESCEAEFRSERDQGEKFQYILSLALIVQPDTVSEIRVAL